MPIATTTPFALSKGLSLSKARVEGLAAFAQGFDKLSPNGFFRGRSFDTSGRTGLGLNANNNDNTVRPEVSKGRTSRYKASTSSARTGLFLRGRSFDTSGRTGSELNANSNDNTVRPEQGTEPVEGPRRRVGGMRARLRQAQPERIFSRPILRYPRTTLRYLRASGFVLS